MSLRIDVLIVTYNRKELLIKTIEKIIAQSVTVNSIIIVDNHSTDETYEFLCDQLNPVMSEFGPEEGCEWQKSFQVGEQSFRYYYKRDNDGGAGGFAFGMTVATKFGSDALWIMDDDGFPEPNCLQELSDVFEIGKIEYVAPSLITFEGVPHFDTGNISLNNACRRGIGGPFNGILVSTDLIRSIGVPRKEFFIWGDEREWVQRVINAGFVTVIANNAIHLHKSTAFNWSKAPRVYYLVRNLVWTARLNESVNVSKFLPWFDLLYHLRRLIASGLKSGNFKQIYLVILGIVHGLTKRF